MGCCQSAQVEVNQTKSNKEESIKLVVHQPGVEMDIELFEQARNSSSKWLFGFRMGYLNSTDTKSYIEESLEMKDTEVLGDDLDLNCNVLEECVKEFAELIYVDGTINRYLSMAIKEIPAKHRIFESPNQMLLMLNKIIKKAPHYSITESNSGFPISNLFMNLCYTPSGYTLFILPSFNDGLRKVMSQWCRYLDSRESCEVLNTTRNGWLCDSAYEKYKLYQFIYDKSKPYWGFKSYNDFFHREINLDYRKLDGKNNDKIIVAANDGHIYNFQHNVKMIDEFWAKGEKYSLINILNNNEKYVKKFVGGSIIQTYLSGADYHRWRSPVSGTIIDHEKIPGLMYAELPFTKHMSSGDTGDPSQGMEACQNTRGLTYIEADDKALGIVVVEAIGMSEVSSISFGHDIDKPLKIGDHVNKGDEIGWFSYGGSSVALIFEPNVIDRVVKKIGDSINVRSAIAHAK